MSKFPKLSDLKKPKKVKIVAYISGGVLCQVLSNLENVKITLIDRDNLKTEGKTSLEIDKYFLKKTRDLFNCDIIG